VDSFSGKSLLLAGMATQDRSSLYVNMLRVADARESISVSIFRVVLEHFEVEA
jgi:hypothetical protein